MTIANDDINATATATGAMLEGLEAVPIPVTAEMGPGLAGVSIEGVGEATAARAAARITWGIQRNGWTLPHRHISVTFPPGTEGSIDLMDVPIALAVLVTAGLLPAERLKGVLATGTLNGEQLSASRGMVPVAAVARAGGLVLAGAKASREHATATGQVQAHLAETLRELTEALATTPDRLQPAVADEPKVPDVKDLTGWEAVKDTLAIALAGGHPTLLQRALDEPTTRLARNALALVGPLTEEERREVLSIRSVAGRLVTGRLFHVERPFRTPHRKCGGEEMGGDERRGRCWPGEVSLAHGGILYLEKADEFPRASAEAVATAVRNGKVRTGSQTLPTQGVLLARPGYKESTGEEFPEGHPLRGVCQIRIPPASPNQARRTKASWLDHGTRDDHIRAARARQRERYGDGRLNGTVEAGQLEPQCFCSFRLVQGMEPARAERVRRIAQTIADLGGAQNVSEAHVEEAEAYVIDD